MDDRTRAFLRELERADEEVSATLAALEELAGEVETVRLRALELEAFLTRVPAERERLRAAREDADRRIQLARQRLEAAERDVAEAEQAGDERAVASARNRAVPARDALRMDERPAAEAGEELEHLELEAATAEHETAELEARAGRLAEALRDRPRLGAQAGAPPGSGLAALAEWASGARAALLVARSSLAAERDALLRQASELAALVFGEPVQASSAAEAARRIDDAG